MDFTILRIAQSIAVKTPAISALDFHSNKKPPDERGSSSIQEEVENQSVLMFDSIKSATFYQIYIIMLHINKKLKSTFNQKWILLENCRFW